MESGEGKELRDQDIVQVRTAFTSNLERENVVSGLAALLCQSFGTICSSVRGTGTGTGSVRLFLEPKVLAEEGKGLFERGGKRKDLGAACAARRHPEE